MDRGSLYGGPCIRGPVNTYKIRKLDDTPLEGTFYKEDLQKVDVDDDGLFCMEKVLKRQKRPSVGEMERLAR